MKRGPFPLDWPEGWKRTKVDDRAKSRFGVRGGGQVSFSAARQFMLEELKRLGAANVVLTSDLPVRNDGLPYATSTREIDSAIAVWFMLPDDNGTHHERVFACDRWRTHAENMQAIGKTVEAMRGLSRWGAGDVVQRAFTGFAALPPGPTGTIPPAPTKRPWRAVLGDPKLYASVWPAGLDASDELALAKSRHRKIIAVHHPDAGGDAAIAAELNVALADAELELGGGA